MKRGMKRRMFAYLYHYYKALSYLLRLMDFTFTRAMMNLYKTNPIKFKSDWSKESKEICTKSKSNSD